MPEPIRKWLTEFGLDIYAEAFERNHIELDLVHDLTDDDLRELGVSSLGHRKRLLRAFRLHRSDVASTFATQSGAIRGNESDSTSSAASAPVASVGDGADRRQLTVMFCDLVDSTALSNRLDPEDYRELIRAYQDACAAIIVRYDGFVARYMGDGILAYFGWPHSHEDDAERAINAGLGIAKAVGAIQPPKGETAVPGVRVGIATGSTIVGDIIGEGAAQEAAATGITPNTAARLQQIAAPNSVVISGSTRELVRDLFTYEGLGEHSLKGIDRPVAAWRVTGAGNASSRFKAVHGSGSSPTRLVGRDHELLALRDRWERALGGEGSIAMLIGEAGIGKSRLTEALVETLLPGSYSDVRFQCAPYDSNSAFSTVTRELERAAGFAADDDDRARLGKLGALLSQSRKGDEDDLALLANLLMLPFRRPDLSPQQLKQRTLAILCDRVLDLTAEKPVLVILEDAHWIDPSSLELMEMIVTRVASARLLIVVTQRPEWTAPFLDNPAVIMLHLARLGRREVVEIVHSVANRDVPLSVVESIVGRTDGIPLFVEEITRSLLESGSEGATPAGGVPESLQASLMARLDRLEGPVRDLAQMAAVIGRDVSLPLLGAVAGATEAQMTDRLDELFRSQLMLKGGSPSEQRIAFRHALIRDAAYQSLLGDRRRAIHRRIAEAMQASFPQIVDMQPELVARHFAEAGERSSAIANWQRAGQRATELVASREALDHYGSALAQLAMTPPSPERDRKELELTLAMGVPLVAATGYGSLEVRKCYERARKLAELVDDPDCLFTSTRGLWNCVYDEADLDLALDLATSLTNLAGSDLTKQALAQRALGSTQMNLARFEEAVGAFDRCILIGSEATLSPIGRDQVEEPTIVATQYKGFARCIQGRPREGLALLDQAVDRARTLRHPLALAFALHVESAAAMLVREFGLALKLATATLELATDHGLVFWIAGSKITLGCATVHLGQGADGVRTALEGLMEWRGTAAALYVPTWSSLIADASLTVGDLETAGKLIAEALSIAETNHDVFSLPELQRLSGEIAARYGDTTTARLNLERAVSTASKQKSHLYGIRAANSLAKLHFDLGASAEARNVLQRILTAHDGDEDFADLNDARGLLT